MKFLKGATLILAQVLIAGALIGSVSASAASPKTLSISGTVVDSATSQPVPQAMVVFFAAATISVDTSGLAGILNGQKLDTTFTRTDGTFSYSLTTSSDSKYLLALVLKQGYKMAYTVKIILSSTTTISIATIKAAKNLGLTNDTLTVTGTIVDSATGNPIENCAIIMSGAGGMDTAGNTAVSGTGGTFSQKVVIDTSLLKSIDYIVKMDGYQTVYGKKSVTSKQVDLGTIKVRKSNVGVLPGKKSISPVRQAAAERCYSVNGRLLNSGITGPTASSIRGARPSGIVVTSLTNNKESGASGKNLMLR